MGSKASEGPAALSSRRESGFHKKSEEPCGTLRIAGVMVLAEVFHGIACCVAILSSVGTMGSNASGGMRR